MAQFKYADAVYDPEGDDDTDVDDAPLRKLYRRSFHDDQNARIAVLSQRYRKGLDFWTGEPLTHQERSELREIRDQHCGGNAPRSKTQRAE